MMEIPCGVCGSSDRRVRYRSTVDRACKDGRTDPYRGHYQINDCLTCGAVYSSPIFETGEVNRMYTDAHETNVATGEADNVRRTMGLYYDLVRPFLAERKRILDIGCDVGFILDTARADRFEELYGVEPNREAADVAARLPATIYAGEFYENVAFPNSYFDLITLIHVLDHLVSPSRVLARVRDQLRPGGIVLAVVHNVRSILGLGFRERFPAYNLYHHYFFSKGTLRNLFHRNGFEVIRVNATRNCYSIGFMASRAPGLSERAKAATTKVLDAIGVGGVALTIPLGNIAIVARRPTQSSSGR